MLIKSSRKSHDKKGIGCDQNNTLSSSSIVHPISARTFKDISWSKTNMKRPKIVWVPKEKIFSYRYIKSIQEDSNIGIGKMDAHYS